jgi:hypothetical protein
LRFLLLSLFIFIVSSKGVYYEKKTDAKRRCREDEYVLRGQETKSKEKKLSYFFLIQEHARNKRSTA